MPDVLTAIADIIHHRAFTLPSATAAHTAINATGSSFELYFKDRLVGLVPGNDGARHAGYTRHLIYQGAPNNPPDAMFSGGDAGDAFEFKKFAGGPVGTMQLNSSWPKDRLTDCSYGITDECRNCEPWRERNLFYVCGGVPSGTTALAWIWICDGRLLAAHNEVYVQLHHAIQEGVRRIPNVTFHPTVELGKVKECDPTDRTDLRIRGMWSIGTPGKLFERIAGVKHTDNQHLHALIRKEKWERLPDASRDRIDRFKGTAGFSRTEVAVPDPNRRGATIPAVLIRYEKVAE